MPVPPQMLRLAATRRSPAPARTPILARRLGGGAGVGSSTRHHQFRRPALPRQPAPLIGAMPLRTVGR
eukprot:12577372-Alexandrium_andersonii.AAC.1